MPKYITNHNLVLLSEFAEHKHHVCDFEIPLKGFGSSVVVDLVAITLDLQVLMV